MPGKWPVFAEIPCCGAAAPEAFSEFEVLDHLWQNCSKVQIIGCSECISVYLVLLVLHLGKDFLKLKC